MSMEKEEILEKLAAGELTKDEASKALDELEQKYGVKPNNKIIGPAQNSSAA